MPESTSVVPSQDNETTSRALNLEVGMPGVETIRKMVRRGCAREQEIERRMLREVKVPELFVERKIRLVHPGASRAEPRRRAFDLVLPLPVR